MIDHTKYWAKNHNGSKHLLVHHAADVAAMCEALLELSLCRKRLALTGGCADLSATDIQRLCFLAALHDLGKCNYGFQRKIRGKRSFCGHVGPVMVLFDEKLQSKALSALKIEKLQSWCGDEVAIIRLLLAAVSHHGRPIVLPTAVDRSVWLTGVPEPLAGLAELVDAAAGWYPQAFVEGTRNLPSNPEFQHVFCGLVSLADWLASDEKVFPYSEVSDSQRIMFARERAREVLKHTGINAEAAREWLVRTKPGFGQIFGHSEPRPLQAKVVELTIATRGGIAIFEAETGSGKTEAAFHHYLRLLQAGAVDGMYFALPTRAAATQIHGRIVDYTKRVFGKAAPPVGLAVPGYIRVDDVEGKRLAPFEVLWPDEERFRFRGWASEHPKRYLAGALVVGTIDQALLSALQVSHAQMRATALSRLLLVADEVHASDTYMLTILQEVLRRHTSAGGHALLLSATLGAAAKIRLLLQRGDDISPADAAAKLPYPAITTMVYGEKLIMMDVTRAEKEKVVQIELPPLAADAPAVASLALAAARQGGRVLVLRNLVRDVVLTQLALEECSGATEYLFNCGGIIVPHHGKYAPADRKKLDIALEARFGKAGSSQPGVVVASRTVEQSLDIDFDLIITDIAPMDVLLQRIGRLHRHDKTRSADFSNPRIVVLTPAERDLGKLIREKGEYRGKASGPFGIGTVFGDLRVIEATWRLLEQNRTITIPGMNRILVEGATHPENLERIGGEQEWNEHAMRVEGSYYAAIGAAKIALFDRDKHFDGNGFANLDEVVGTRLGENDRIVNFSTPICSPFGNVLSSMNIPGWMMRGVNKDELVSDDYDVKENTFSCCGRRFVYDRLGLREDNNA